MNTTLKILRKHWLIAIILFVLGASLASVLVTRPTPFYDWDESIYVQIGTEMVRNKTLTPTWQGYRWLDKPFVIPLFYALIAKFFFFVPPEVSLRLITLAIGISALALVYALYYRATKNKIIASLTVILTAFSPVVLQRLQVVNMDIFVLLGWAGYVVFFGNFWLSFLFLAFAVGAKSLVGFYPLPIVGAYYLFLLWQKKIKQKEVVSVIKKMLTHAAIFSVWYIIMLVLYRGAFITEHIIETHFKRVTASIEFHFGERIFYFTLLRQELGNYALLAVVGLIFILYQWRKKKLTLEAVFYSFYLLPWFIFLNLTKTKIFWYILPAIPQFSYLATYPLRLLEKNKRALYLAAMLFIAPILYHNTAQDNYLRHEYSKKEAHYYLALYARDNCDELGVLVNKKTRDSFKTLEDMNLLITTSKWWGSHPSVVYYFGKRVYPFYTVEEYEKYVAKKSGDKKCVMVEKSDEQLMSNALKLTKQFETLLLYQSY